MQRMTDALSRMLNDPSTRLAMRTLGDREIAATRNYQRSQSEQQIDEDDEIQSNDNSPPEAVESEINRNTTENDNQMHVNEGSEEAEPTSLAIDESLSENVKCVPDITIESCRQNVVTDKEDPEMPSHKYLNEKIKDDKEPCVLDSSSLESLIEKEDPSVMASGNSIGW